MSQSNFNRILLLGTLIAIGYSFFAGEAYSTQLLIWCSANVLLATSMRFMMLVGEFNMATVMFYGIGAYVSGYLTTRYSAPFATTLLAAGSIACVIGIAFGYVSLRIKGAYFMIISFAFAEVARLLATQISWLGGNSGIVGIFPPAWIEAWFPAVTIGLVVVLCTILKLVEDSSSGKVFAAIRNNDAIVQAAGISVLNMKVVCLALSAFVTGVGGALYAYSNNVISPADFTFMASVMALAAVKLGGENDFRGPILGAVLLTLIGQYVLRFGALDQLFYGGAILVAMLALPGGLMGVLQRWRVLLPVSQPGIRASGIKRAVKP